MRHPRMSKWEKYYCYLSACPDTYILTKTSLEWYMALCAFLNIDACCKCVPMHVNKR